MRLTNNLFSITAKRLDEKGASYDVMLHPDHFIYQAHFPGEPVTPGVCIIQMVKELLEDLVQLPLCITAVKNVKFLSILSPIQTPQVTCKLTLNKSFAPHNSIVYDDKQAVCERNQAVCETDALPLGQQPVVCSATVTAADTAMSKLTFTCHVVAPAKNDVCCEKTSSSESHGTK